MKFITVSVLSLLYCAVSSGYKKELPKDILDVINKETADPERARDDLKAAMVQEDSETTKRQFPPIQRCPVSNIVEYQDIVNRTSLGVINYQRPLVIFQMPQAISTHHPSVLHT